MFKQVQPSSNQICCNYMFGDKNIRLEGQQNPLKNFYFMFIIMELYVSFNNKNLYFSFHLIAT